MVSPVVVNSVLRFTSADLTPVPRTNSTPEKEITIARIRYSAYDPPLNYNIKTLNKDEW